MIKNKKATHVGMILSFMIFVTFLAFLYSITEPAMRTKQDKFDALRSVEAQLLEKFSEDMTSVLVEFREGNVKSCSQFKSDSFNSLVELNLVIRNVKEGGSEIGEDVISSSVDGDTGEPIVNSGEQTTKKTRFFYSKEFEVNPLTPCSLIVELNEIIDYNISLFRTSKYIFESKIKNISDEMKDNSDFYQNLKQEFGLSFDDDFEFDFKNRTRGDIVTSNKYEEVSKDIFSEEIPIQYVDDEARILPGFIVLRVW